MDEEELLEQFKADLGESKAYMEPIQQRMDRDYEAYRNFRTKGDDTVDFKVSDLFEYVETVVPIVTNNRIRATVHSDYPEYVTHAKGLNDILDHTYDVNNWDYISQEIMRMALIYRSSAVYTGYDKKYKNGTGRLCVDKVNFRWCWVDPNPTDYEDSRFFFRATPMRKSKIIQMYPDKKADINEAVGRNSQPIQPGVNDSNKNGGWFRSWLGTVKNFLAFNGTNQAKIATDPTGKPEMNEQTRHKNVVAYIEYWYRDDEDNWRCSYWADDCLLHDEPNPFWHGMLPYDIFSPVKDPLSMLGVPMSEQIESMNVNRNLMMNYVLSNGRMHANPPLLFNTSFGNVRDPQKLKEQADDGVIPVSNPDMIPLNAVADYMNIPVMPGYVTSVFDQLGQIKDAATGVNDSFRGTQQASSGKEVQLQQEAAYTRIKTMIDQFELVNKRISEKTIINAMQFHNQNRGFRIKGDYRKYDNEDAKTMPFEVDKIQKGTDEQGEPVYDRTEFFIYANPNEWTKLDPEGGDEEGSSEDDDKESPEQKTTEKAYKILQMTVEIEAGSSLPQSRLARREEANELFQAGAIDQESLLDTYDWPDREEIMKRMTDKAQQMQEAQAQAAMQVEQAKAQMEQQKLQAQKEIEQMKIQADLAKSQATNQAKIEQQHVANRGQVAEQGAQNSDNSLAGMIEQIKQSNPQAAQMSDEQIIQAITGQQAPQQDSGLAGQLDQIKQQHPEAAQLSDQQLVEAIGN